MRYSQYQIRDDQIEFSFYEFYFSSLRERPILTKDRIRRVNFNTYPCTMEIDGGEIIFFNHDDGDNIKAFAKRNHIPVANKVDVWARLCREFLDVELGEESVRQNGRVLTDLGFTSSELRLIRKRIRWILRGTWEWTYLGHWDLLAMKQYRNPFYRFSGQNFYWWTMEVAARGR